MIANKILNVMTKIGPIIKDKTNEEKGFEYASLSAVIMKAREAMIQEKIIFIPMQPEQIIHKGNMVIINMVYRFYDAEPNQKGENEYIEIKIPGEGCDNDGWAVYKALSGAYKYAITQTFAIPTVDDAEKGKISPDNNLKETITNTGLDETNIENILGESTEEDFDKLFSLDKQIA